MIPSAYQLAVYRHQAESSGNARVIARAGSGKTSLLVEAARRLPSYEQRDSILVAFNTHIAQELRNRVPRGMEVKTVHSLARAVLQRAFTPAHGEEWVDKNKYRKLARRFWRARNVDPWTNSEVVPMTEDLLRFTMLTLTDPADETAMRDLAEHFGLYPMQALLADYFEAVRTLIQWGIHGTPDGDYQGAKQSVSFDDMVYLVNVLDLPVPVFKRIFVDECQDLSAAQREFILRMLSGGGRALFVGDPNQSLYAFAGADTDAFDILAQRANTTDFPLSICYRCPVSHLQLAQEIVPEIEPRENAPEGLVADIHVEEMFHQRNGLPTRVQEGDLVICRTTAPLMNLAFDLIGSGIPAEVRGRDIGASLGQIIDAIAGMPMFTWSDFLPCLYDYREQMICALSKIEDNDLAIESFTDRAASVETIYYRALAENVRDVDSLRAYVRHLFNPQRGAVQLSTIHGAKGLESDRVFILAPELMPHPRARREWERTGEQNLKYVALTRAKHSLFFVQGAA